MKLFSITTAVEVLYLKMNAEERSEFIKKHINDLSSADVCYLNSLVAAANISTVPEVEKTVTHRNAMLTFEEERRKRCKENGEVYHTIGFLIKQLDQKEKLAKYKEKRAEEKATRKATARTRQQEYQHQYYMEHRGAEAGRVERRKERENAKNQPKVAKERKPRKPLSAECRQHRSEIMREMMRKRWADGKMPRNASSETKAKMSESAKRNWSNPCFKYRRLGEIIEGMQKSRIAAAQRIVELANA